MSLQSRLLTLNNIPYLGPENKVRAILMQQRPQLVPLEMRSLGPKAKDIKIMLEFLRLTNRGHRHHNSHPKCLVAIPSRTQYRSTRSTRSTSSLLRFVVRMVLQSRWPLSTLKLISTTTRPSSPVAHPVVTQAPKASPSRTQASTPASSPTPLSTSTPKTQVPLRIIRKTP
jgi:hypothetical protein